jgi:hypothetical protein
MDRRLPSVRTRRSCEPEKEEDAGVNDEMQRRAIMIMSTALAGFLSSRLADKFIDIPEERGIKDDVKEALLKAAFSVTSTIVASVVIRRVLGSR